MARARNIKPGLFKNELLAEQSIFSRLLFIGLWTLADREGRMEDRPRRIKMELFPCDSEDIEAGLASLSDNGFIVRYEVNNVKVIQIVNFLKHQTPHGTEKDSDLPDQTGQLTIHPRDKNGYVTGVKRTNNVNSGENNSHPPLGNRCTPVSERPDSPNPDSLNPDLKTLSVSADGESSLEEKPVLLGNGKAKHTQSAIEILGFLNDRANRRFKPLAANLDLIASRLKEGATIPDCKAVIIRKCKEWGGTDMDQYLRPATLFNKEKFAQYSGEVAK